MTPAKFQELTFLIAHHEDDRVISLERPDGGLDAGLPDPEDQNRMLLGWQAKRHTGRIDWPDCKSR
jgi:hypothetical protein